MKQFLFVLMLTLSPLIAQSQDYDSEGLDPILEEQILNEESGYSSDTDFLLTNDVSSLGEERQEDTFYPEAEETEWNLEGEALPAEDYQ